MAFVWVQQWIALPVVVEEQMGDIPPQHGDYTTTGLSQEEHGDRGTAAPPLKSPSNATPFYSQFSSLQQAHLRPDNRSSSHPADPRHAPSDHGAASALNMGAMEGALPDYASIEQAPAIPASQQHGQRPPLSGASTSALVYQLQQNMQVPGPSATSFSPSPSYGPGYAGPPYQQSFTPAQSAQQHAFAAFPGGLQRVAPQAAAIQPAFQGYPQQSPYMYYPSPYGQQTQYATGYPAQSAPAPMMYGRQPSLPTPLSQGPDGAQQDPAFMGARMPGFQGDAGAANLLYGGSFPPSQGFHRNAPTSSVPRGPPRKPKQSGHALWVGNLPPGTTVIALKDHFSRDATKDIESLFLIAKSNCAFVNYRTEASCTAAMHRFHDSRFNGVRLVCRLRRSSVPASGVPTGPSAMVGPQAAGGTPTRAPADLADAAKGSGSDISVVRHGDEARAASTSADRYFIVKSLTLQDLELSVRNGMWATQSHNEDSLNKAFETAKNVFLIFSANKSGEYFGYARMSSSILESVPQVSGSIPEPATFPESVDAPRSIPTPATDFAPKGRIIDDSARGTIFWEAELSDSEMAGEPAEGDASHVDEDFPASSQSWGKPFKIEWVSTNRLPFYRTRGLRNPWNANREVKIARDGTELEPSVGERLVQMFHRLAPASTGPAGPQLPAY